MAAMVLPLVGLAVGASANMLSNGDLARAYLAKPLAASHVLGGDATDIFEKMNKHLVQQQHQSKACEEFTHQQLNDVARILWEFRSEKLASIYTDAGDKRKFHFDGLHAKESLWAKEIQDSVDQAHVYGPGTWHYSMVRDGKCAEMVMWWIHHLPQGARNKLSAAKDFVMPFLPKKGRAGKELDHVTDEYVYQVSCSDCHSTGGTGTKNHGEKPTMRSKDAVNGVAPGTCPTDEATGKPSVWYRPMSDVGNRKKRCDWDYDPPCQPCEGIGGYSWGDQEHEISYTSCRAIANASEIPEADRVKPIWPKAFIVKEITTLINQINTGGQFPGADPCAAHKFTNDTETMYYDGSKVNFPGPIMYTKASKTSIYTLPDADMFIKILGVYCICVTPYENGNKTQPATGPLRFDFAADAAYIGREEIGLEGLDTTVVADHWGKGPHHFWVDVKTKQLARGFQPYNGLNVYVPGTWEVGPVSPDLFDVPKSCYDGYLHKNISCRSPYPMEI